MKCDYCDNKATVFLTQLAEGQMKKVCLCDSCAKERGVTDPTGFSMSDLLLGNFQKNMGKVPVPRKEKIAGNARICPECGFSFEDLQKVRRFGCGNCYKVFASDLAPMLRGMHKGVSHVGKVPEGLMEVRIREQKLEELRDRLELAIASESYEEAAELRDEINNLDKVSK
ncbi:UvrB/UvrC motif-containing protein [Luteolibacter algae]|uniref:UvrB/UvrC motif-containing protein n=1 Tax=Luteolibacter algae TaxID=454151 RepID=A0ABW5D9H3_9BACT